MAVEIVVAAASDPLGTASRRKAVLLVELDDGRCRIEAGEAEDHELDTVPLAVREGVVLRWTSVSGACVPDVAAVEAFAAGIAPLLERVAAGHLIRIDDVTAKGTLDADAREASALIDDAVAALRWGREDLTIADAATWAAEDMDEVMRTIGYGDGPGSDDERLAMEGRLAEMAAGSDCVLVGIDRLFRAMRERSEE